MDQPPRVELLTKAFMIDKALSSTRRYEAFHPSAWGSCLRKIAYQHYNEKKVFIRKTDQDVDLRMERIYDNGHGMHARWQNYLDCAGVLRGVWKCPNPLCGLSHGSEEPHGIFNPLRTPGWACKCGNDKKLSYEEVQVKSDPRYNFEGHVDAIVDVRGTPFAAGNGNDLYIADFKTIKAEMFDELQGAKHEHVVQVHIYMWLLGLSAAMVVYESKDSQHLKEMHVPRDEAMIADIQEKAEWLIEVLKRGKLPQRPDGFSLSKFPCRLCEFAGLCYA
jgi:hypothetical protein